MAHTVTINNANSNVKKIENNGLQNPNKIQSINGFAKVIEENTQNIVSFNVMPERNVTETLHIKEYHIKHREITGVFDREYETSMKHSPNHLIFLTALVHLQKLILLWV